MKQRTQAKKPALQDIMLHVRKSLTKRESSRELEDGRESS